MIKKGDALTVLAGMEPESVHCCVTSPPYWGLRDYGVDGQLGLEQTPEEYVERMVEVFSEVKRVLRDDGTLWLNLGDSYAGSGTVGRNDKQDGGGLYDGPQREWKPEMTYQRKTGFDFGRTGKTSSLGGNAHRGRGNPVDGLKTKDLIGIPWRVAFALQRDGWYLRCDIIWAKPNPMPESVKDRPTKAHEYIFLMSKNQKYYYDADAIRELADPDLTVRDRDTTKLNNTPGRTKMGGLKTNEYEYKNKRSVWNVPTQPFPDAHFAVFPPKLIEPCILAGSPEGGIVLDPFFGSGTTGLVAKNNARKFIGIELNEEYIKMAEKRLAQGVLF